MSSYSNYYIIITISTSMLQTFRMKLSSRARTNSSAPAPCELSRKYINARVAFVNLEKTTKQLADILCVTTNRSRDASNKTTVSDNCCLFVSRHKNTKGHFK